MLKSRMKEPDAMMQEAAVSGGSLYMIKPHLTIALGRVGMSRSRSISFLKGNLEINDYFIVVPKVQVRTISRFISSTLGSVRKKKFKICQEKRD